jgi:hypothetical protein
MYCKRVGILFLGVFYLVVLLLGSKINVNQLKNNTGICIRIQKCDYSHGMDHGLTGLAHMKAGPKIS